MTTSKKSYNEEDIEAALNDIKEKILQSKKLHSNMAFHSQL